MELHEALVQGGPLPGGDASWLLSALYKKEDNQIEQGLATKLLEHVDQLLISLSGLRASSLGHCLGHRPGCYLWPEFAQSHG